MALDMKKPCFNCGGELNLIHSCGKNGVILYYKCTACDTVWKKNPIGTIPQITNLRKSPEDFRSRPTQTSMP